MESTKFHYENNDVPNKNGTDYWELKMLHIFLKSETPNFF